MKLSILFTCILICTFSIDLHAQDTIHTKDHVAIPCKIIEETDRFISYYKLSLLNGPIFRIPIDRLESIVYDTAFHKKDDTPVESIKPDQDVVEKPEIEPVYSENGMEDFFAFIRKNLIYPEDARRKGIQGKVYVEFIVELDGSMSEIQVKRSFYPSLDQEAIRVISIMPNKWTPGKQNGKNVRVRMTIPIFFKMS